MAAILIFVATYLVVAIGRLPGLRVDRTGAAIIGASLMVGFDVLTLDEAFGAIDADTILLLFGMMIVVANLRMSGFFALVCERTIEHTHRPILLLAAITTVAGVFSAFFVNDTLCLVLTPLVVEITTRLRRNPAPYLLAVAMGSNVGSVATLTGNPQNMMIGSLSGIPYGLFARVLTPVALAGLAIVVGVIWVAYRKEFSDTGAGGLALPVRPIRVNRMLLGKSLAVAGAMVALFFAGWQVPKVALVAGAALLLTRRVKPERVYREIDWGLLVLFSGLFVVVAGAEKSLGDLPARMAAGRLESTAMLTGIAAVLSNLLSNVPAVLVLRSLIGGLVDPQHAWMVLAMATTLAGNLTILGSVANLIVVERAKAVAGVEIGFWDYARVGVPVTVISLAAGVWILG